MSTLHSMQPTRPVEEYDWLIDTLLPAGELVLLDGAAGIGKSLVAASLVANVSHSQPHPGSILYLTSPDQHDLTIEQLALQVPNYDRIRGVQYEPDPDAAASSVGLALHLFQFIQGNIVEHKPSMMIIDSLEELLQLGADPDTRILFDFWHDLRELACNNKCTLVIPRKNGLHETRQYGPFTRLGSDAARFALTLHWHPTDPAMRVLTVAKHQRGPTGEQAHLHIMVDGQVILTRTATHQHVRPSKTPHTWQPEPKHTHEDHQIMTAVQVIMHGSLMPRSEILNHVKRCGISEANFERAMRSAKLKNIWKDGELLYFPTVRMMTSSFQNSEVNMEDTTKSPENHTRAHDRPHVQPTLTKPQIGKPTTQINARQAG